MIILFFIAARKRQVHQSVRSKTMRRRPVAILAASHRPRAVLLQGLVPITARLLVLPRRRLSQFNRLRRLDAVQAVCWKQPRHRPTSTIHRRIHTICQTMALLNEATAINNLCHNSRSSFQWLHQEELQQPRERCLRSCIKAKMDRFSCHRWALLPQGWDLMSATIFQTGSQDSFPTHNLLRARHSLLATRERLVSSSNSSSQIYRIQTMAITSTPSLTHSTQIADQSTQMLALLSVTRVVASPELDSWARLSQLPSKGQEASMT